MILYLTMKIKANKFTYNISTTISFAFSSSMTVLEVEVVNLFAFIFTEIKLIYNNINDYLNAEPIYHSTYGT